MKHSKLNLHEWRLEVRAWVQKLEDEDLLHIHGIHRNVSLLRPCDASRLVWIREHAREVHRRGLTPT